MKSKIFFILLMIIFVSISCENRASVQSENTIILKPTPPDNKKVADQGILDANLCELMESPKNFEGKTVRIKTIYRYGFEWSEFYSLKCDTKKRVWVEGENTQCENAGEFDEMDFAGMGGRTFGVIAVGQFIKDKDNYGHLGAFDYLFEIKCFEKSKLLDRDSFVRESLTPEQTRKIEEFEKSN